MKKVGLPVTPLASGARHILGDPRGEAAPAQALAQLIGIEVELCGVSPPGPRGASASWWASSRSCMSQKARPVRGHTRRPRRRAGTLVVAVFEQRDRRVDGPRYVVALAVHLVGEVGDRLHDRAELSRAYICR